MNKLTRIIFTTVLFTLTFTLSAFAAELKSNSKWYGGTPPKSDITTIAFQLEEYTGDYDETWEAGTGSTGYLTGTDVIVSANGDEEFIMNKNSSQMFYNFSSVTSIEGLDNLNAESVENMSDMFKTCSSIEEIDISSWETPNLKSMDGMFSVGGKYYNGTILGDAPTQGLTSITFGSGFDTSDVKSMRSVFDDCDALTDLDLSMFDTSNVEDFEWMFHNCCSLTSLDLSDWDTSNCKIFRKMFYDCISLNDLDISNFSLESATDVSFMFNSLWAMTEFDLSNFEDNEITNFRAMFWDCRNVTEINLCNLDTSSAVDTTNVFWGCNRLTKVITPEEWHIPCDRNIFVTEDGDDVEPDEPDSSEEEKEAVNPTYEDEYKGEVEETTPSETPEVPTPTIVPVENIKYNILAPMTNTTSSTKSSPGGGGGSGGGGGGGSSTTEIKPTVKSVNNNVINLVGGKAQITSNGQVAKSAWVTIDGKWYATGEDGFAVAPQLMSTNGKYYSFNSSTNEMRSVSGYYEINGVLVYLAIDSSGAITNQDGIDKIRALCGETAINITSTIL